jgi:hypothetical protein
MSCLSCKPTQRAAQPIVYEKLLDQPVRVYFLRPASKSSTQDKLGALPGQLVACLFTVFISLDRISILDCLISVNILDRLISVVLFLFHKI